MWDRGETSHDGRFTINDSLTEEGVQAYGGSYSSVTSSGSIRYEFGVMQSRQLRLLPSLCENAVKSGLA